MTSQKPNSQDHLPLSPAAFSILLALKDGDKHGYAILREVAEQSDGKIKLLPGTLYNLLKRMLEDGWIAELDQRPDPMLDDERRRYYRLTALGARMASLEAERMAEQVKAARKHGILAWDEDP
jgi:DNA-binding PadR family transcriptional regulator